MIRLAGVHLLRRAGVERERGRARVDELRADLQAGARPVRKAAAHLHRDRKRDRIRDRLDDRARAGRLLQAVRTGAGLRHLAHGAAEVDVDDVRARVLDHPRSLGHDAGLRAEDLHRERMLVGGDAQVPERALVLVGEAGAADHLRADEPGAETTTLAAKRLHAHACHGRQNEPRRNLDVPEAPGFVKIYLHTSENRSRGLCLTLTATPGTMPARDGAFAPRIFSEEART